MLLQTLIPVRGRKQVERVNSEVWDVLVTNLNPRKGTETGIFGMLFGNTQKVVTNLNPRKGTETSWVTLGDELQHGQVTNLNPRKGTETYITFRQISY